ncbi:spermidine/putrescine ABC transporter substrate-binding protein [Vibrio viridaestus]|uniref:Spermidine/putrescine ABC transporter substrate-binding protein n=2 Tax=Vibrio viridaestus TaxID=2487322 RepID=A0A3N9TFQ8_9VIBR|nr:spermidine/putrescine ABC transporter substrate-binding protein [Vibrio viridaestus]RQW63081.1 spermidine/putrescine ABC transporter substrate-binding protein [Vibrio viridaestus]
MKTIKKLALTVMACLPIVSVAKGLNIYLWEDTLSNKVLSNWESETDIPINRFHFDNDDERSLLMLKSVQLPFDIIVLDNVSAQIFARQDAFEDLSDLKGRNNIDPKWNDVCGSHAIPYFWGSVGILYRKSIFKDNPPNSWSDFMNPPDNVRGHIGIIQDSIETLLPAMYSLGVSPATDNIDSLKTGYEMMSKLNKDILTYEYALSYVRSHKNSENLYMALAYSGDQASLNRFFKNNDWSFVTPEGAPYLWFDCMAINSNSEHKEEAKKFLNYLTQPKVAAQNALDIGGATPNIKALDFLPDSYKNDRAIFPEPTRMKYAIVDQELSPQNLNIRAKIINSLITQHEANP